MHLLTVYWAAVLMYAALGTPFATFLMTTYYRSLPDELIEAAICRRAQLSKDVRSDRAADVGSGARHMMFLQFIQIWDDLLVGLLFLQNPSDRTITVGLGVLRPAAPPTSPCSWPARS